MRGSLLTGKAALYGALLRLLWVLKQSQTALVSWTVEENKPIKIHKHGSGRKRFLDCLRTVSEVGMIWRGEIPCHVSYNNMVDATVTATELGKHQVSL